MGGGGGSGRVPSEEPCGAGSCSVAHRAGLLPAELTGMWGWILLRSPHKGRGSPPAPRPHSAKAWLGVSVRQLHHWTVYLTSTFHASFVVVYTDLLH